MRERLNRHLKMKNQSKPQRCINIWLKNALLALYQAIKKRLSIFKISPYVQYALVLENIQPHLLTQSIPF